MEVLKQKLAQNKYLLILSGIYIFFLFLFWGRFGDPIVDCGREAYIPYAMADLGKVLFKDLICIYGPLPYYLNAFIVKLFGANLNTINSIGAVFSYVFLFLFYLLSKRFLGAKNAFFVSLVTLFLCVFSPGLFNFIFPYSFATLYALVFSLFYIYFILKFIETKTPVFSYVAALFLAFTVLSKYDFLPCALVLPIVLAYFWRSLGKNPYKILLCCALCFFIPFLIIAIIFILQGVNLSDIAFNFQMMSNMAHSKTLKYFYKNCTGFAFSPDRLALAIKPFFDSFFKSAIIFLIGAFSFKIRNIWLRRTVFLIVFALGVKFLHPSFFFYPLIVLFFLFLCLSRKKYFKKFGDTDFSKLIFIIFTLTVSLKSLFGLIISVYGTFYFPCIFISFCIILETLFMIAFERKIPDKEKCRKYFSDALCLLNMVLLTIFIFNRVNQMFFIYNSPLKSLSGTMFAPYAYSAPANSLIEFLEQNLKNNDDFLVLPEGLFFNFVLKKDYPYFNTSFIPLDFEAYGEEYLTKNVLKNRPRYLIITNRDSSDYGKRFICKDYGQKFCAAFNDLYIYRQSFGLNSLKEPFLMHIFERKTDAKK